MGNTFLKNSDFEKYRSVNKQIKPIFEILHGLLAPNVVKLPKCSLTPASHLFGFIMKSDLVRVSNQQSTTKVVIQTYRLQRLIKKRKREIQIDGLITSINFYTTMFSVELQI